MCNGSMTAQHQPRFHDDIPFLLLMLLFQPFFSETRREMELFIQGDGPDVISGGWISWSSCFFCRMKLSNSSLEKSPRLLDWPVIVRYKIFLFSSFHKEHISYTRWISPSCLSEVIPLRCVFLGSCIKRWCVDTLNEQWKNRFLRLHIYIYIWDYTTQ